MTAPQKPLRGAAAGLLVLAVVSGTLLLPACQPADPEVAAETDEGGGEVARFAEEANRNAINARVGDFIEAYQGEDLDRFMSLFTEDAVRMPPDAPALVGKPSIRINAQNLFTMFDTQLVVHIEETELSGDLAFVRGTWSLTSAPAGESETTTTVGKWMNLMKRGEDGAWRIARNIWNRDAPPET